MADDQDAEREDEGDGDHEAHVTPGFGPGHFGALPERDLVAGAGRRGGEQALRSEPPKRAGQDERGDGLVGRGVSQLPAKA